MKYRVISTGSKGNAVLYSDHYLVDCGVNYAKLKGFDIRLVMLTHIHQDHFNKRSLQALQDSNPRIRFVCCEWLKSPLEDLGIKNIDVLEIGKWYDFGPIQICPIRLYHDVPNCGYRMIIFGEKVLHATDTKTLEGVIAKDYDLYAIEHNYDEDTIEQVIKEKINRGEYSYEKGAINSHLSFQKAKEFFEKNRKVNSKILKLHMSSRYEEV